MIGGIILKYKNIIFILCDSLTFINEEHIYNNFDLIKEYKENILFFNNIFSQGPYTEAAIQSLLSGNNTLDNGDYFQNIKYIDKNLFYLMQNNNYNVFQTIWNYANTESFFSNTDSYVYMEFINLNYFLEFRLDYLKGIYSNGKINKYHIKQTKEILEDFFITFDRFIKDYYNNKFSYQVLESKYMFNEDFIKKYNDYIVKIKKEYFNAKEDYILGLFKGSKSIDKFENPPIRTSKEYIKVKNELKNICIKRSTTQITKILLNSKKNKSLQNIVKNVIRVKKGERLHKLKLELMYSLNYTGYPIYSKPSFGQINLLIDKMIDDNKKFNNFIFLHSMDNHFPFNFISYDTDNAKFIKNEFRVIKEYLKCRNINSTNVFYDLAMRYVNNKIKDLIKDLESKQMLDNTLIVITADHGCSYLGNIYREKKVSNFYDETYKTPLIIYNPNIKGKIIENYGSSIDIIPTIFDIAELDIEDKKGKSLLKNKRDFIFFEYLGAGCPDSSLKKKHISIRNEELKVNYIFNKNDKFTLDNIDSIFDLKNDKYELKNLKNKNFDYENDKVKYLIKNLSERVEELRENEFYN